jgi:hypothetical protein
MLHNNTRENLLQQNRGYVALVVDALYFLGLEEYATFSLAEVLRLLSPFGTSPKLVALALRDVVFQPVGRRNRLYTLPPASTVRKAAGASSDISARDLLPQEAFASLHAYRLYYHHALIARGRANHHRARLAARLGVTKQTTRHYDRKLRHIVTAWYSSKRLTEKIYADLEKNGRPHWKYRLFIKYKDMVFFAPARRQIADLWRSRGAAVEVREQVGNLYEIADYITTH